MTASGFTYSVVAEKPETVREDLGRVWRENLTLGQSPDAKFRSLYRDAPDVPDGVFVLRARDGSGEERVVGTMGIVPRRFWIAHREALAAVSGDFAVDVAHRHLLPALNLARSARAYVKERFALGYGLPNDKAEAVMVRAGFGVLGKTSRFVRVLRHAAYAQRVSDRKGLGGLLLRVAASPRSARAAGFVADVGRLALDARRSVAAALRYDFAWQDRPDGRFDTLWTAARDEYEVVGARTSAFLAWRCPGARFATITRRREEALRAYAVVETDPSSGAAHVRDLFGHVAELGPLLDLAIPALWARGATSVSMRFMGAPEVRRLLAERGFVVRGKSRTVVLQIGDSAPPEAASLATADRWHLFDVDEDA